MASLNKVFLMGNLTRDPVVRYVPSGAAVADFGLAVNESFKNKDGEEKERTCFVDIETWERSAELVGEYLKRGSPVLIEGRLLLDEWKTPQGEKRSKLKVRADRVQFLGAPRRAEAGGAPPRAGRSPAAPPDEPEAPAGTAPAEAAPPGGSGDDDNLPF